ncbi:MAG: hypothetical protein AAF922_13145 [Pseudomonadota bacterium]
MSRWAEAHENQSVLAASIELALRSGASLERDDPWSIAEIVEVLLLMPGGVEEMARINISRTRGVISGVSRLDVTLAPRETETVTMTMAGGELAVIEARLKRDSIGADLDLIIETETGLRLEDTGPETGTVEIGTYLEFWPETCMELKIYLSNSGSQNASAVLLAPASSLVSCGN